MVLIVGRVAAAYLAKLFGQFSYLKDGDIDKAVASVAKWALVFTGPFVYAVAATHWHFAIAIIVAIVAALLTQNTAVKSFPVDIESGRDMTKSDRPMFLLSGVIAAAILFGIAYGARFIS